MQALVPHTAGLELQLRQFEPGESLWSQKAGLLPVVPVRVGERIMPEAEEKQRGLRP